MSARQLKKQIQATEREIQSHYVTLVRSEKSMRNVAQEYQLGWWFMAVSCFIVGWQIRTMSKLFMWVFVFARVRLFSFLKRTATTAVKSLMI